MKYFIFIFFAFYNLQLKIYITISYEVQIFIQRFFIIYAHIHSYKFFE